MEINPKIKQKAEDIRKKIFGSEVRESLASGIEAISEDVEATIGRQDYVEEQFQDVLDETTGKDVINGPEVIAARNGELNLKTRLDKEKQEVTAQLQQKADQSVVDGTNSRIDNLILESGGDSNLEVADARTSVVKDKTFSVLGQRLEETENSTYTPITNILENSDFSIDSNSDGVADGWRKIDTLNSKLTNLTVSDNTQFFTGGGVNFNTVTEMFGYGFPVFNFEKIYFIKIRAKRFNDIGDNRLVIANGYNKQLDITLTENFEDYYGLITPKNILGWATYLTFLASESLSVGIQYAVLVEPPFSIERENISWAMYDLLSQFPNKWFSGSSNAFDSKRFLEYMYQPPASEPQLMGDIRGTRQKVTFNVSGDVQMVQHLDIDSQEVVREDTYDYNGNTVTEARTLQNGDSVKFRYDLTTYETEVI